MHTFAEHLLYLAYSHQHSVKPPYLSLWAYSVIKYGYQQGLLSHSDLMIVHHTPFIKWHNAPIIWAFKQFDVDAKGHIRSHGRPTKQWNKVNDLAIQLLNQSYRELRHQFERSSASRLPDKLPIPVSMMIQGDV